MTKLYILLLAGALIFATASADVPCMCTKEMRPVCGTDSVTYSNLCELKCAKRTKSDLDVAYNGGCKPQAIPAIPLDIESDPVDLGKCFCTREMNLVCASNGKTYDNPCVLKCAQKIRSDIKLVHHGSCKDVPSNIIPE